MITLKAPEITPVQRKSLKDHKTRLESAIAEVEGDYKKAAALRKKEASLEREAESLKHDAAKFNREAEIALSATLKQIERVHEAIHAAEASFSEFKAPLFKIIDQAQELVGKICQTSYEQLLDEIGARLAPYYSRFGDARYIARDTNAINDLVKNLLGHGIYGGGSIEGISEGAREMLRKVDALLNGSTIWTYHGAEAEKSSAAA